jgi:hypothetical protein
MTDTAKIIYRPNGGQVFMYPLIAVFAPDKAAADIIAGEGRLDGRAYNELAIDSAEAQNRLGIWGRPELAAKIQRGD